MGQSSHDGNGRVGRWYVLQTKQHREEQAQLHLQSSGITCYLPKTRQWPRPAVGGDVTPLFPGYLFVRLDLVTQYPRVRWTPGVRGLVAFDADAPAEMPENAIEFLKSGEGDDGLFHCDEQAADGSTVRVVRGPFRDFYGVVKKRLTARDRVIVLLDFLQRELRVDIPEGWLKQANHGAS